MITVEKENKTYMTTMGISAGTGSLLTCLSLILLGTIETDETAGIRKKEITFIHKGLTLSKSSTFST